jgi:uncharacterized protein YbjT (DUF2867 family)
MAGNSPLILLVGATGQVGSRVASKLVARGARIRALVRDVESARRLLGPEVDLVSGDLMVPATLEQALDGADVASLATAPGPELGRQEVNFVEAAQRKGLPRLVVLAAAGIQTATDAPPFAWHARAVQAVDESGIPATVLRPTPFHSLLLSNAEAVRAGTLPSVMGTASFGFVDPDDVADLTVAALDDPTLAGQTWDVGGPEALTFDDVAATFTRVLGHRVRHVGIDEDTLRSGLRESGRPDWLGDVLMATATLATQGAFTTDDSVVRRVRGRRGRSLSLWIDRNRTAFLGAAVRPTVPWSGD